MKFRSALEGPVQPVQPADIRVRMRPAPRPAEAPADNVVELVQPERTEEATHGDNVAGVVVELKNLTTAVVEARNEKNAANRRETAALKALQAFVAKNELPTERVAIGDKSYQVGFLEETVEFVSVERLRKLVSDADFMRIVSATKDATKKLAGDVVLAKATETKTEEPKFKVSEVK